MDLKLQTWHSSASGSGLTGICEGEVEEEEDDWSCDEPPGGTVI